MKPPHDEWVQGNSSGSYTSTVDKLLIHTTEGSSIDGAVGAYRANNSWPHLTVDCMFGHQYWRTGHLDLDVPARSLRNKSGGTETNTDGVIQIEVVGFAGNPSQIDWAWFGEHVVAPICAAKNIPVASTLTWVAYPDSYGEGAAQRLSSSAWGSYRGILGHQHAPENDHGDPGAIPISTILAGAQGEATDMTPEESQKLDRIAAAVVPYYQINDSRFRIQTIVAELWRETLLPEFLPKIAAAVVAELPEGSVDVAQIEAALRRVFAETVGRLEFPATTVDGADPAVR